MGMLLRLTWRTIAARPTLTVLAVLLLAFSTVVLYGLVMSASIIGTLRGTMLSELAIEIELSDYNDSTRTGYVELLRTRPDVLSVNSLSARDVLDEVEQELGESLREVLSENPFPPILRVKLRNPAPETIEGFVSEVSTWSGVLQVVYPKELWKKFDNWMAALRGRAAYVVAAIALIGWTLVGLTLRAILRGRRQAWQLLLLLGARPRDLEITHLLIEVLIGVVAGLAAATLIYVVLLLGGWLLLFPIVAPQGWMVMCIITALCLSMLAGVWAPRPSRQP